MKLVLGHQMLVERLRRWQGGGSGLFFGTILVMVLVGSRDSKDLIKDLCRWLSCA